MKFSYKIHLGKDFVPQIGEMEGSSEQEIRDKIRETHKGKPLVFKEIKKIK